MRFVVCLALVTAACSDPATTNPPRPSASSSGGTSSGNATFKADVAPIIAANCALAACHKAKESNLNFHVTYDPSQIYDELMKASPTCPSWKFVTPGKPDESMLVLKIDHQLSGLPVECASARKSEMPPGDPPGSGNALMAEKDRETIRKWIALGAKND